MRRFRVASVAVATVLVAACSRSSMAPASIGRAAAGPPGVVATFTGVVDPSTGTLSIQVDPASDPGALTVFLPFYDGTVGTGPVNSFEIVTDPTVVPSTVLLGCNGGTVNAWEGDVIVRSFFRNQTLKNVYVELTNMSASTHAACNSVTTPVPGVKTPLSAGYGLWSYGDLVPNGSGTGSVSSKRTWKLRLASSEEFTFQGRIWATLGGPTAISGGPEFDWSATSLVKDPPRSFQVVGTTVSHIVWDGSSFVDSRGGVTFTRVGGSGGDIDTYLSDVNQPYATFLDGSYWVEDPYNGNASRLPLDHGFTVCAKIKPGASPPSSMKTIFAKANPIVETGVTLPRGFALMQMNGEYCFHYRTEDDVYREGNEVMTYVGPGASPEAWTYDYICGGRAATNGPTDGYLWAGAHGVADAARITDETGFFIGQGGGEALPLAIGATADGFKRATDMGLYEVIIDSRGATPDVMRDIVAAAEGRLVPGASGGSARYEPANSSSTPVTGADGVTSYTLPPYATLPVSTDGSGLLDAGTLLRYTRPLQTHTNTTGFCVGVDVQATGAWSAVRGTLLQFDDTSFEIQLDGGANGSGARGFWMFSQAGGSMFVFDGWGTENGWADGSDHVFKGCAGPEGALNRTKLFLDGTQVVDQGYTGLDPDWAGTTSKLYLGSKSDAFNPLSGARIRRVFICPNPNPASCN